MAKVTVNGHKESFLRPGAVYIRGDQHYVAIQATGGFRFVDLEDWNRWQETASERAPADFKYVGKVQEVVVE